MIVSNKFLRANYGRPIRRRLIEVAGVERIVDLAGLRVFAGATVRPIILVTRKGEAATTRYSPPPAAEEFTQVQEGEASLAEVVEPLAYNVPVAVIKPEGWSLGRREYTSLVTRMSRRATPLIQLCAGKVCMGIKSGLTAAFVISAQARRRILRANAKAGAIIRPFLQGRNIRRYCLEPQDKYLIYTHHGIDMKPYPAVVEHLRQFRDRLQKRATKQAWYELQQPQYAYVPLMERPKIVFPDIATGCRFTLDEEGHFGANTVYFLPTDDRALLGLLNSRLALFYFKQKCAALEGAGEPYLRFFGQYLEGFPVRLPDPPDDRRSRLAGLVAGIMSLYKRLADAKTDHSKTVLQRQIETAERQIDQLVYELYGLTDEEVRLVEQAVAES